MFLFELIISFLFLIFIFVFYIHYLQVYWYNTRLLLFDKLRPINHFGFNLEKQFERGLKKKERTCYIRFYVEDWYHVILNDYNSKDFLFFKKKKVFINTGTINTGFSKLKGSRKIYTLFYDVNLSQKILGKRDYFLTNKNYTELTFNNFNYEEGDRKSVV